MKTKETSKYGLGFISDEHIKKHVRETVLAYRTAINLSEFNHNVVDPIKLTFDSKIFNYPINTLVENECMRQIDKTNTNYIGYFHQNLFKYAGNDWEVPRNGDSGFDVQNPSQHIFVEMKNKHNTMNSASSQKTYIKMQNKILQDDKAVCMLVEVITKGSHDSKWHITLDNRPYEHDRIRRVSIDRFYTMVFNDRYAFAKLCAALPDILDDVMAEVHKTGEDNTVYQELSELSPDILRSLYLLAFKTYDGFDKF